MRLLFEIGTKDYDLYYKFPGGGIEEKESAEQAKEL